MSITETLLLAKFVIYANGAAPAILTSTKVIAIETKATEYNFFYLSYIFPHFPIYYLSKKLEDVRFCIEDFSICFLAVAPLALDIKSTNIVYNHEIYYLPTHPFIFDLKFITVCIYELYIYIQIFDKPNSSWLSTATRYSYSNNYFKLIIQKIVSE